MALNRTVQKEIRRTVIRATEELLGRKLSRAEVVRFIGQESVMLAEGCGRRLFDCHRRRDHLRQDYLLIRWGYPPEAARNGCLEEVERWLNVIAAALRDLMRRLGRRHLPVVLVAVSVDERGMAIDVPLPGHRIDF